MRFYVINHRGLVATTNDQVAAERLALVAAVHTGRPVEIHDRYTED